MDSGLEIVGLLVIVSVCLLFQSRNLTLCIGLPAIGAIAYWLATTTRVTDVSFGKPSTLDAAARVSQMVSSKRTHNLDASNGEKPKVLVSSEQTVETFNETPAVVETNSINSPEYTPDGMQKKRDEILFRKPVLHQSSESRGRILDSMYQEMLDTSMRRDPYLRKLHNPEPLRGLTKPHIV